LQSKLFTPFKLGPVSLRNRTIRSAAFEGMCPGNLPSDDILEVVKAFGETVHLARASGFDAVEVHAGHGYLISQFLSPYTNKRKDEFGGTLLNRARVTLPLVYVGGLVSTEKIDEVLNKGFELVALARVLIKDPDFINKLQHESLSKSACDICNYCIAVMYTHEAVCIQNIENPDPAIIRMLGK
jgi:2,4-dienoyl-CoA reductase-like NADH-dependent reductase (Old Yellow Enzyme family)